MQFNLEILQGVRLEGIAWAQLPYTRPRSAGKNARLDIHGIGGMVPIAQLKAGEHKGFGWCTLTKDQAEGLVGYPLAAMFAANGILLPEFRGLEFPLLDWLGNALGKPVYELVSGKAAPHFSVPVYDTSLYFDEPATANDKEAVAHMVAEAAYGLAQGHQHFKVKIGRCGMWMPLQEGLTRDIAVVLAIRDVMGTKGKLMVDANNGYNLSITKTFLSETKPAGLHWLEEAFYEDNELYRRLKDWMQEEGINTLIADGEGDASPQVVNWAKQGLIDVLQYDLRGYGFFNWLELNQAIKPFGILAAPHNYGGYYGNFAQVHFAAAADNFAFAELDIATVEEIDQSAYSLKEGRLYSTDLPGFALALDEERFYARSKRTGWRVE